MIQQDRFLIKAARLANVLFAAAGVLFVFTLFYYVYHFAWSGAVQFTDSIGMVLYYGIPAVLASLSFFSLRLKPVHKVNVALLGVALAVSVFGVELFLQWSDSILGPAKPFWVTKEPDERKQKARQIAKQFGVDLDTRTPLEFLASLRKKGIDAVPVITPSNHLFIEQPDGSIKSAVTIHGTEVIPFGGLSNKVTVLCNENGYYVTYPSDEHGFHNPGGIWRSHRMDVVALGDSFAHGYCVPSDKNFMDPIRQRYPATLNLGIAGDGPLLTLATLKEYVAPFKPQSVLWFYYENNDLTDLQTERKSPLLMRYLEEGFNQNLLRRQRDIDQAITDDIPRQVALEDRRRAVRVENRQSIKRKLSSAVKFYALRDKLKLDRGTSTEEVEGIADLEGANMDLFRDVLSQVKTRVSAWQGTLYFVYLPTWGRYAGDLSIGAGQRTRVLTLVSALGIPIIDLHPAFQAQSDPLSSFPFREYGHYNEKGHRLVAEEVLRVLQRETPST